MKKLSLLLATICCSLAFAQEKTYQFENKITYDISFPEEYNFLLKDSNVKFINYYTKNTVLGLFENLENEMYSRPFDLESFLIDNKRIYDVYTNSLENKISIKVPDYLDNVDKEVKPYEDQFIHGEGTVKKLNTSQTINSFTCNDYQFDYTDEAENQSTLFLCIDENNPIDNNSILVPQSKIKGLLVSLKQTDTFSFILNNIATTSTKIKFDEQKQTEIFNTKIQELKSKYDEYFSTDSAVVDSAYYAGEGEYVFNNKYEHPFCDQSKYFDDYDVDWSTVGLFYTEACSELYQIDDINKEFLNFAKKSINNKINFYTKTEILSEKDKKDILKINKKIFKDAKDFKLTKEQGIDVDPGLYDTATPVYESEIMEPIGEIYQSEYKNINVSPINLAIDQNLSYRSNIPKYCDKISVPDFKEGEFSLHVKNFVSQLCDLYAIPFDDNVAVKQTIDSMRKSLVKINELKEKQNKNDQKLFDDFINSLD